MTEPDYPEVRVAEADAPCPALTPLPELPVTVLVLASPGVEPAERKGLAELLSGVADELGAGDGVHVHAASLTSWHSPLEDAPPGRHDIVILRPDAVAAEADQPSHPAPWLVDRIGAALADASTRFWLIDPPLLEDDVPEAARREDLARRVVAAGGPPAVILPAGWRGQDLPTFHVELIERVLHDAPLVVAVERACGSRTPAPQIFLPAGRRHGLDLARLLEDHRMHIDEASSGLRAFVREIEAAQAQAGGAAAGEWAELIERIAGHEADLTAVKEAFEEINRDRDPAGWSRLTDNIARLGHLVAAHGEDRDRLAGLSLSFAPVDEPG